MINANDRIIMIDTETTNDIDCPIVYDVGYHIFSLADGGLCERSFVNADVFLDKELMSSAYFIDKVDNYWHDIKTGKRELKTWYNIRRQIAEDCKRYGVKIAVAHNARFDNKALNTTQRYITTSKNRYFLPYGTEWWDTLKMARSIFKNDDAFGEFCYENDYLTKNGCRRYTAEILYRFIKGINDFEESHTALEDVLIEKDIFLYCINQNPELDGKLWND